MDNITHTLVGAALAEAGLKRRTALGTATLMIGANFPDIDVIAVPLGYSLEWRRGVTHGIPALFVLPFLLAGLMVLWDRQVRRRRNATLAAADPRQLVVLATAAILTHPTLDFMNTYGMRWLMPFVDRWFYADGLFIVDFWMLTGLALGVYWARRAGTPRPARIALAGLVAYVVSMLGITEIGRARVAAEYPGHRYMVEPHGLIPWRRGVLVEEPAGYRSGTFRLFDGLSLLPPLRPKGDTDPAAEQVRQTPEIQSFLRWARFPVYDVRRAGGRTVVRVSDARYGGSDWASVEVTLP